jgi:hypothetical protein
MSLQYSVAVNNARLDSIETTAGTAVKLRLYTGTVPANCAASETGTLLVEMTLPSDWMNAASSASKTKLGTWSGTAAATGTAAHFRVYDSAGTTCHIQGTAGTSGTDMILDNTSIATGQTVTANTFTLNAANT